MDDPIVLLVGTEVSAKYKGAFCEAKIKKVAKAVRCKVQPVFFKGGTSFLWVSDDFVKGDLKVGAVVEVKSVDKKAIVKATILKIQDCSQYTVVFDDGDVTSLKRTSLCLKSGKHFASSATLDQLPLTHPEHFSAPTVHSSAKKNRKPKSDSENISENKKMDEIGKVVCVMSNDKKIRHNWFPGLIVAPKVQSSVKANIIEDYMVRSFKDGKYHSVSKKDVTEFTKKVANKVENSTLKTAVEKAMLYLDKDELPPHWDRDVLFGHDKNGLTTDSEGLCDTDNSEEESIEEKDHFVAQLFKFMDDRGTPLNQAPVINDKDVDLYKLFKVVNKFGGFNKVDKFKQWKTVAIKIGHEQSSYCVKLLYQQYLCSFEDFDRKLGCTMLSNPRSIRSRNRFSRNIIRDVDKSLPSTSYSSADKNKQSVSSKQESNEKKDKPDTIIKENDNIKDTVGIKKITKASKTEEKNSHKNKDESSKTSDKKLIDMIIDTSNALRNKPLVKSDSKLKKELKETIKKEELKVVKFDDNENSANKKNEKKKSAKGIFGKSMPKPNKKDKIVKVKSAETGLTNSRKKRSIKEQIKTIVKVMTPFKKSKKDSNNQLDTLHKMKSQEDNIPKLTRSKSKDDFPSKSRKLSVINEPTCSLQDVQTLPSGSNLESINKAKKSDDCSEKKKAIKKKKEDVDDDKISDNITIVSVLNSENEIPEKDTTPIAVGDNLVVYYGDKQTTTYDAKVLTVSEVRGDIKLYVHYKGWNSRYDEWIDVSRIASRSKGPETDIDGDSLKNEQKISDSKKLPMTNNRTRRSITPNMSYPHRKKSPLSSARPTRTCTLNDKPLSSIGKYTIRDNSDSESEYSGNLGLAKQYNKKNQQALKTTKFDYDTDVKTELSDSHGQKKTYPKTYPSKELLMQRSLPRKPKSCMIKVHSNTTEETDVCEQKTLKETFNLKNIEDNKNVKEHSNDEKDPLLQNKPKLLPINSCPKNNSEKQKLLLTPVSECLGHCDEQLNMKEFDSSDVLKKSKNARSEQLSENKDKTKLPANKELISGTDFDLNKIRSEMKGLTPTFSSSESVHKSLMIKDQEAENKILKTIESDSEKVDIYEFKESESCDFKSIPSDIVEKLRKSTKNDLPISYNFQKSSEGHRVNRIVSQGDEKNNSVSLGIIEENESNRLFESNSVSGIDKYVKRKDCTKKDKLLLKNQTKTEKYISQSDSDESNKSNSFNISNSNDYNIVNSPKDQVLDLCIKPPQSPNNIFSMSETNDSNAVEFDDEDESKLVIADFQGNFETMISSHRQTENLQIESPYSNMSQSTKINTEFRSSHETKSAMSSKDSTDDESTISCNESIQNDLNFQLDSQFENESTKKKDCQPYVDNENSSQSSFEFESNLNSTVIKNSEVEFSDMANNEKCLKYDYINKKKIEKESTSVLQKLECKEFMSEDSLNNSFGMGDQKYNLRTSNDNFHETSTSNNTNNSSLEIKKLSVVENDIFETIASNTIKSNVIENNRKVATSNNTKNSSFENSNYISARNSEGDINNVLFCEETIPGSPNGAVTEELIDQEDRKKLSSTQYADKESTLTMLQSCNPMHNVMNATNNKIEINSSNIKNDDDKLLEQRNLHFLADVSNKNYNVNFDKSVLPKSDSECNVLRNLPDTSQTKRKNSHYEHELSKRAKTTLNNSSTIKDGVVQKPVEIKIPLKDGKPLVVFTPEMDSAQRQALIVARIHDLRREYLLVKARLAVVDRRRKKIKKRKRELAKFTTIQNKLSTAL